MMDFAAFFHMTFVFWIVLDSPGNIPICVALLNSFEPKKQRRIIWREMFIALFIMLLFLFFGEGFFTLINIDYPSLQIAGGMILFLIALRLLFAGPKKRETAQKDPLIVPLAVPCVAGPGILATISLYSGGLESNQWIIILGIVVAWLFSLPLLLLAPFFKRALGENGLIAIERLFGYVIILIATDMMVKGVITTFRSPI